VILPAEEIQILFSDNIWISLPLPSLIYALKGYQVQQRYFGYSCQIFYLFFLKSQQTVFMSFFYSIVHASYHLCGHKLQTHLTVLLSFEPSLSLPVPMTMKYRHGFLQLLVISHRDIKEWNYMMCCVLVVQCTFFQNVFWVIASFI
jgi:hypothetical protein